ncbi:MAG: hypothetical protein ACREN5_14665 [Gemmatimonadales bacterium]
MKGFLRGLLGVLGFVLRPVRDVLERAFDAIVDWVGDAVAFVAHHGANILRFFADLGLALDFLIRPLWDWARWIVDGYIMPAFQWVTRWGAGLAGFASRWLGTVTWFVRDRLAGILRFFDDVGGALMGVFRSLIGDVIDFVRTWASSVIDFFRVWVPRVIDLLARFGGAMWSFFDGLYAHVRDFFRDLYGHVRDFFREWVPTIIRFFAAAGRWLWDLVTDPLGFMAHRLQELAARAPRMLTGFVIAAMTRSTDVLDDVIARFLRM